MPNEDYTDADLNNTLRLAAQGGVEIANQVREQLKPQIRQIFPHAAEGGTFTALCALAATVILFKTECRSVKKQDIEMFLDLYWRQLWPVDQAHLDQYLKERAAAGEKVAVVGQGQAATDTNFARPEVVKN